MSLHIKIKLNEDIHIKPSPFVVIEESRSVNFHLYTLSRFWDLYNGVVTVAVF